MLRFTTAAFLTACLAVTFFVGPDFLTTEDGSTVPKVANVGATKSKSTKPREPRKIGNPPIMSPHADPIAVHGKHLFVVNTPCDTVDVIDTETRKVVNRIAVGIDPCSIEIRPDGKEVWVSNHVSDSVSVIDNEPASPTYQQIKATIQSFDSRTKATSFDEPMGIAFANNEKAYVALSSENQIAVIDVKTRKITNRLKIRSQDPRDIEVRDGKLFVIPFESNNKTQLSGGSKIDGDLVTFNAWEHSVLNNNVLSLGHVVDIVKHPKVPDRDLFIFDTETDELIKEVDTLGTLLYGLAVDSNGRVFISQTDARNDVNGRSGTKKHGLKELENRAFLNQITAVEFNAEMESETDFINLEPLPPHHPKREEALATPFGIEVSEDDNTLFVSAAGSNKLFTVDTNSGLVLDQATVGAVPRGVAIQTHDDKSSTAWVFNAVANTVTAVDATNPSNLKVKATVELEDNSHDAFKRGRIAFNDAMASTTGTFSCASCHPDGHTDQLLWVLKTPVVTGGNQIMPRSTMPLRGLRDTAPFHWDGIPGDPYGGNNSESIYASVKPNVDPNVPESASRHLIDGGLSSTMKHVDDETKNDEGKAGMLSAKERDDMAKFLLNITFPPAQRRAFNNELTSRARRGFELFHIVGDEGGTPGGNLCGNCHRMPFNVSTNTPGTGMDAPTWRGAYDRWLILPQGRLNIIDFDFFRRVADQGLSERSIWQFSWGGRRKFDPVWEMVTEQSTGFSGSFARQVTLNKESAKSELSAELLDALETSSAEGAVVLQADGVLIEGELSRNVTLQFDETFKNGTYVDVAGDRESYSRAKLISLASEGKFVGTFTARHGEKDDYDFPQPALWTVGNIHEQRGRQEFPVVHAGKLSMEMSGRHLLENPNVYVDGRRVEAETTLGENESVTIKLNSLPSVGMHFLQVQNKDGLFSNDFIFHAVENEKDVVELQFKLDPSRGRRLLSNAINGGDLKAIKSLLARGVKVNGRRRDGGRTPLSEAAFRGDVGIVKFLLSKGARVSASDSDGNTPLHMAAFMTHKEVVEVLLENGASLTKKNNRTRERPNPETAIDVVKSEWNDGLANFYRFIARTSEMKVDVDNMEERRAETLAILKRVQAEREKSKEEKEGKAEDKD